MAQLTVSIGLRLSSLEETVWEGALELFLWFLAVLDSFQWIVPIFSLEELLLSLLATLLFHFLALSCGGDASGFSSRAFSSIALKST